MRDCLLKELPIAVLVRKSRMESARARVETILARWEVQLDCVLPRPVVFEGDICQQDLGLDLTSRQWVQQNCHSVLHSAASLSFELDEATNEPWRSNLEGTRNVLDFVRSVGIRQFHHVSTSYVCGLRTGTILESDVDVGQTLGNPYEESKLSAEKLVREADGLDRLTVHRPAIIVGDSQTGYTTTYHGFYTPLKVVHSMVDKVAPSELDILFLLQALGLNGQERKNFVPVDWVSSVMTHILSDETLHGRTYHLTPRTRVTINEMAAGLSEAIQKLSIPAIEKQRSVPQNAAAFDDVFRTQMETYQSYWRDDPQFDSSNTISAAPHLPCPEVDAGVMWRLAKYAIENNFGWPVPSPIPAPLDIQTQLVQQVSLERPAGETTKSDSDHLVLEIAGPGGGQWTLELQGKRLSGLVNGRADDTCTHTYMSSHTFRQLASAEISVAQALRSGALVVTGASNSVAPVLESLCKAAGNADGFSHIASLTKNQVLTG